MLRSETDILAGWSDLSSEIVVSVCCITYNHAEYIEDALRGILMQETKFRFEIIVHDDMSTDGTREIIKRYHKLYPNLIRPVFQTENQYSKGVRILSGLVMPHVVGKYLALCEGDDYWTDPNKLANQVCVLEHHDTDICFHPVVRASFKEGGRVDELPGYGEFKGGQVASIEEVLRFEGGAFALCSILIRRDAVLRIRVISPDFYEQRLTHFYYQLVGSVRNGAAYVPKYMGVYRSGHPGSWSSTQRDSEDVLARNEVRFRGSLMLFMGLMQSDSFCRAASHMLWRRTLRLLRNNRLRVRTRFAIFFGTGVNGEAALWRLIRIRLRNLLKSRT